MSGCDCSLAASSREQSRVLWLLLAINAVMFVVEIVIGMLAESTGLIADALDMLADATVWRRLGWHELLYEGMPGILAGVATGVIATRRPATSTAALSES